MMTANKLYDIISPNLYRCEAIMKHPEVGIAIVGVLVFVILFVPSNEPVMMATFIAILLICLAVALFLC